MAVQLFLVRLKMYRLIPKILALFCVLTLSACFFPEKFDSDIQISKDGNYTFKYDGILTFVMARAEQVQTSKLSAKADADLKKLESELKKDPGFKSAEYVGNSQYKVRYEKTGTLLDKQTFKFPADAAVITVSRKGNVVEVKGLQLGTKELEQLKPLKMEMDGKINLKTSGVVKNHNASSTPTMGFGSYGWKLKAVDEPAPLVTIEIN